MYLWSSRSFSSLNISSKDWAILSTIDCKFRILARVCNYVPFLWFPKITSYSEPSESIWFKNEKTRDFLLHNLLWAGYFQFFIFCLLLQKKICGIFSSFMRNFTRAFYEITGTLVDRCFWVTVYERDSLRNGLGRGGGGTSLVDFVTVTQTLVCVLS